MHKGVRTYLTGAWIGTAEFVTPVVVGIDLNSDGLYSLDSGDG